MKKTKYGILLSLFVSICFNATTMEKDKDKNKIESTKRAAENKKIDAQVAKKKAKKESSSGASKSADKQKKEATFACTYRECEKAFKLKKELTAHAKTHTGDKPYKCEYEDCDKEFVHYTTLHLHENVHNKKQYACTHKGCTSSFDKQKELQNHVAIHNSDKPHKCTFENCDKAFVEKSTLEAHLRVHTGEKAYKCSHIGCGKTFARQAELKEHARTHTKNANAEATNATAALSSAAPVESSGSFFAASATSAIAQTAPKAPALSVLAAAASASSAVANGALSKKTPAAAAKLSKPTRASHNGISRSGKFVVHEDSDDELGCKTADKTAEHVPLSSAAAAAKQAVLAGVKKLAPKEKTIPGKPTQLDVYENLYPKLARMNLKSGSFLKTYIAAKRDGKASVMLELLKLIEDQMQTPKQLDNLRAYLSNSYLPDSATRSASAQVDIDQIEKLESYLPGLQTEPKKLLTKSEKKKKNLLVSLSALHASLIAGLDEAVGNKLIDRETFVDIENFIQAHQADFEIFMVDKRHNLPKIEAHLQAIKAGVYGIAAPQSAASSELDDPAEPIRRYRTKAVHSDSDGDDLDIGSVAESPKVPAGVAADTRKPRTSEVILEDCVGDAVSISPTKEATAVVPVEPKTADEDVLQADSFIIHD